MVLSRTAVCAALALAVAMSPLSAGAQTVGPRSVADLVDNLMGSVVNISTSQNVGGERPQRVPRERPDGEEEDDTPFQEFFDEFFENDGRRAPRRLESQGSGFVISADGVVVTNNHVIKDADEVTVNFADGRQFPADIVGRDPKTDIAVLKLQTEDEFEALDFAASDGKRVGDWVMAIGNPFGLGGTVTVGIISARNRNLRNGPYDDFIQTDAAINRGNSGGPLFDMEGNVIGINTAIISPSGGSIGIGFAIPSEIAQNVIGQLLEFGETRRGWLGVRIQRVTEELAEDAGLQEPTGAMVAGVTEDGPADEAGIRTGDVVLRFDGEVVEESRELPRIVAESMIGEELPVTVLRDGDEVELAVTLGLLEEGELRAERPEDDADATDAPTDTSEVALLGMALAALTEERRTEYEIDPDVNGVLVLEVEEDSNAADKRVVEGDVILEVGQRAVSSPSEVLQRVEALKADGRSTALLTLSNPTGGLRFTALRLE
ncbi:MAG: Do family serine endopeptidase [Pseudomonadota bacterium]